MIHTEQPFPVDRLRQALLLGDREAIASLARQTDPALLRAMTDGQLLALTDRHLAGQYPFCQLTAAAHAACVLEDASLPPVACCGCTAGNTSATGLHFLLMLLRAWGIPAQDLGADVSTAVFLSAIRQVRPRFVVCSVFSAADAVSVRQLHEAAVKEGLRGQFHLLICGANLRKEALRDLPVDHPDHRTAAVAKWMVTAWKS